MKRHPEILLRLPETTSLARASGFNRSQIDAFFNLLTKAVEENNISADHIYIMDESGISVVQKMTKILAKKRKTPNWLYYKYGTWTKSYNYLFQ